MPGWKIVNFRELVGKNRADDKNLSFDQLPVAVKRQPLLLGKDLDHQVQVYIASLCEAGGVVNNSIY